MGGPGKNFHLQEVLVFLRQLRLLGLAHHTPAVMGLGQLQNIPEDYIFISLDRVLDITKLRCYKAHLPGQARDYWAGAVSLGKIIFFT